MNKNYFVPFLIFIFSCSSTEQEKKSLDETSTKLDYKAELVGTKQYDTIQNFYFLISTTDTSK